MQNSPQISRGLSAFGTGLFFVASLLMLLPVKSLAQSPFLFRGTSIEVTKDAPAQTMVLSQTAIAEPDTPTGQWVITGSSTSASGGSSSGIIFTNLRVDPVTQKIIGEVQATCAATAGLQSYFVQINNPTGGATIGLGRVTVVEGQVSFPSAVAVSQKRSQVIMPNIYTKGVAIGNVTSPTLSAGLGWNTQSGIQYVTVTEANPVGTHIIYVTVYVSCTLKVIPITITVVPGNEEYQGAVGDPLAGSAAIGQPGSVLSFLYTSNENEDTLIRINNLHLSQASTLHLLFISAGGFADQFICLAPLSTFTIRASEMDPVNKGRLLVVAVNALGAPTSFNYLSGTEDISLASGHAAKNLKAISYQALFPEGNSLTADETGYATINLDGVSYSKAARTLKLEDVPNPAEGNDTVLFVLPTSLSASGNNFGSGVKGMLYNKKIPWIFYPFAWDGIEVFTPLSDSFPVTTPSLSQILTGGKNWQMVFYPTDEMTGITGLWLNRNAAKPSANKADWLRPQALTSTSKIVVPVFSVACF